MDGRTVAQKEMDRKRAGGTGPLVIGARPDDHTHFDGAIDEMALHRRALTADEIIQRFKARGEVPPPDVKGVQIMAWSFEDTGKTDPKIEAAWEQTGPRAPHRTRLGLE